MSDMWESVKQQLLQKAEVPISDGKGIRLKFSLKSDEVSEERLIKEGYIQISDVLAVVDGLQKTHLLVEKEKLRKMLKESYKDPDKTRVFRETIKDLLAVEELEP